MKHTNVIHKKEREKKNSNHKYNNINRAKGKMHIISYTILANVTVLKFKWIARSTLYTLF